MISRNKGLTVWKFILALILAGFTTAARANNIAVDYSSAFGPAMNQGNTMFCQSFSASDILSFKFRFLFNRHQQLSPINIALVSQIFSSHLARTDKSNITFENIFSAKLTQYQDYLKLPLTKRGQFVDWTLFAVQNTDLPLCREKEFAVSSENGAELQEQIDSEADFGHTEFSELFLMEKRSLLISECKNPVHLPDFSFQLLDDPQSLSPEDISELLKTFGPMSITYRVSRELARDSFPEGLHVSTIVGIDVSRQSLGIRNHFNENCFFKETEKDLCPKGIEWISINSIIKSATSIVYLEK